MQEYCGCTEISGFDKIGASLVILNSKGASRCPGPKKSTHRIHEYPVLSMLQAEAE